MRPLLRGIIAAATLSLAPVAVATTTAPAHAAVVVAHTAKAPTKELRNIKFTDVSRGARGRGKFRVTPNFEGKRLLVQSKKNGKFETTRKARTNDRGIAIISFQASVRGITYRVVAPGSARFRTAAIKVTYRRY